jgi:hypothetical protein
MKSGPELSSIKPDESENFLTLSERSELFRKSGTIQPDVIGIPKPKPTQSSGQSMIERPEDYSQLSGEFKIERGFAGQERATRFSVSKPTMPKGADYILYRV